MHSLQTAQIVAVPDRALIQIQFDSMATRDRAFHDLSRLQHGTTAERVDRDDDRDVAHQLDMLCVIHDVASTPDVDVVQARAHLIYITGIVHGLIRNLGGTPPPIPPGFFSQRLGDGRIEERPGR